MRYKAVNVSTTACLCFILFTNSHYYYSSNMSGCRSFALNIVNTTFVECEMYNIGEIYGNYSMTSASTGWFLFVSDG